MPTRLDHVIVLGSDLEQLEATFTLLGFWVTGGGTHPHLGTQNRIILLDEGYIELLAIADPARVSPRLSARLATGMAGAGWVGFAVQSGDIDAEVAAMRARGVDVHGPSAGRLVAPNGTARGWRVATVGSNDLWTAAEPLPFLIQHDATSAQHRAELAGADGERPHPNGAQRLLDVAIATPDLATLATRFAQSYALTPASAAPATKDDLGAQALTLSLPSGGEFISLAQPSQPGIAHDRLQATGEGVCLLTIVVADLTVARRALQRGGVTYYETDDDALLITGAASGHAPLRLVASAS
ncbi:MAG TPA: VOC family protein [Ktedonobacterales bacterium]|nr:VOC family protein [Ktedonobacterales bacterium]